ncbi:MAG: trypsin-like serine protease [Myxococcota bacterium]
MLVWFVGAITTLAVAPTSLGAATPDLEPQTIVGGEDLTFDDFEEYSGVVAVVAGSSLCTGTLVEDGLILTAAHCLLGVTDASQIRVFNGLDVSSSPSVVATGFGGHPDFEIESNRDAFDYGYVTIPDNGLDATPIPTVIDQDEWDFIASTLSADGNVILVGYGIDPAVQAPGEGIGIKRRVTTRASKFTDSGFEFIAGGGGKDSCEGDSGGPAFARNADGALRLIGITARGSDPCGKGGFYGVPYHALAWVSEQTSRPLCGDACGACDCLDTSPPPDDGCGCTSDSSDAPVWSALMLVGLLGLRTRRR